MTKLNVSFNGITDTTGYLFSLAKCFAAALKHSRYEAYAEDIIAASGFAFRMWVNPQLCLSAISIWELRQQKPWFENSGLICNYVERLWGEDAIVEERRLATAIELIRTSVNDGIAAVAWDLSGYQWGIITGYDDENRRFFTLKIDGSEDSIPYESLGKLEIPMLSVLTVTGAVGKSPEAILNDTKKLALSHLNGEEWSEDNAKGLAAYDVLITFIKEKLSVDITGNLEYYLGTYAALKWYAWKFFEKYQEIELARLYTTVYEAWKKAFDTAQSQDITEPAVKAQIAELLSAAQCSEQKALSLLADG